MAELSPLEASGRHVLSNRDFEKLTGDCSRCGPVRLIRKSRGTGFRYRCKNAVDEQRIRGKRVGPHGLTASEAAAFRADKNCAICGATREQDRLCVDHDHATMQLRGVLCVSCNAGLGFFRDRTDLLANALAYLQNAERSGSPPP